MIRNLEEIKEKKRIAQEKPVTDKTGTEEQAKDDKQLDVVEEQKAQETDKTGTEEQAKDDKQLEVVEEQKTQETDKAEPREKSQDGKVHKSK